MRHWYSTYYSQTWYANTFLVRRPNQIGQVIGHDHEWNNIHDSGCHFTCLAMILNVDPGRLASDLRNDKYYFADGTLPAKRLKEREERLKGRDGGLVWDQNAPNTTIREFCLRDFWHSTLNRRVSLTLGFSDITSSTTYNEGCEYVADIRARGNHCICGTEEHSLLVAGESSDGYFLWDPDGSGTTVEENLAGSLTLKKLFGAYPGKEIEFWEYNAIVV